MLDLKLLKQIPKEQLTLLSRMCKVNLARRSFYNYCKTLHPKAYTAEREYLKDYCNKLQLFYEDKLINKRTGDPYSIMIVNMPPRFFKTFTINRFTEWILGKNPLKQAISTSYNQKVSIKSSRSVRDNIMAEKKKSGSLVYSDIFPKSKMKSNHGSVQEWSLDAEGASISYLATSFEATLTSYGCNGIFVVDDQICLATDATNEQLLADHWYWLCNTALSRIEEGGKLIIVATRWADADLCGRLLENDSTKDDIIHIKYEAMDKNGKLLCPDIMSLTKYNLYKSLVAPAIFAANYHQRPINNEGRLFKILRTYKQSEIDISFSSKLNDVRAIIDPSSGKNDYLAAIAYIVKDGKAYITNIYHTDNNEKINPDALAKWLMLCGVKKFKGEINVNRQFILDIHKILQDKYGIKDVELEEIHTTDNKQARIQACAYWVQQNVFFPERWNVTWKDFYDHVYGYQVGGKNKYDDAPDALSMLKNDVYNNKEAIKQVHGFAIPYKRKPTLEERYFYGG